MDPFMNHLNSILHIKIGHPAHAAHAALAALAALAVHVAHAVRVVNAVHVRQHLVSIPVHLSSYHFLNHIRPDLCTRCGKTEDKYWRYSKPDNNQLCNRYGYSNRLYFIYHLILNNRVQVWNNVSSLNAIFPSRFFIVLC